MSAEEGRRKNLGRGLSALLGGEREDYAALDDLRATKAVPVDLVRPGRFQPRRRFDDESMAALAASVRENGILQPLLVRRDPERPDGYEIVAGERRWRAAQQARLHEVPIIVRDIDDRAALELALVENVQREDLSPLEEAEGYRRLMEEFRHTQEQLAQAVGKSRSHVANMIRLLALPEAVKEDLDAGKLSAGHARALLNATDPVAIAGKVIARGLNVRQTERLVQRDRDAAGGDATAGTGAGTSGVEHDADTAALERELTAAIGLKVALHPRGQAGELVIRYQNLEQLDDILQRLTHRLP